MDGWARVIGNSKREINFGAPILTLGAIFIFVFDLFLSLFQLSKPRGHGVCGRCSRGCERQINFSDRGRMTRLSRVPEIQLGY